MVSSYVKIYPQEVKKEKHREVLGHDELTRPKLGLFKCGNTLQAVSVSPD